MSKAPIQLSDHFTCGRLLRFTLPSIIMMIFTSGYSVVDGFFVSNYVGKTSFAAVNFIMPVLMILGTLGFMFGTGGSALVAKTLGEGNKEKGNRIFSFLVYFASGCGIVLMFLGFFLIRPLCAIMGAEGEMLSDCVTYGRIILIALPAFILQMEFQSFFVAAEKPDLGLYVSIICGVTNMVLDALLVAVFSLGLQGAAWATAISEILGGVIPFIYFSRKNKSLLRLGKAKFDKFALIRTCTNGSSELMSNISSSIVGMLYNMQLMKYAGEDGVAAYGVLMYVSFTFCAAFMGYSMGTAPIISYHFGAVNRDELKGLLRRSLKIISVFAIVMFGASLLLAKPLSMLFVGYDKELVKLTCHAFYIFSFSFLMSGFSIFASGFFTALNDGLTSALISFLRTLVFQIASVLLLPMIWGTEGIWASILVAEFMSVVISAFFLVNKKSKYGSINEHANTVFLKMHKSG